MRDAYVRPYFLAASLYLCCLLLVRGVASHSNEADRPGASPVYRGDDWTRRRTTEGFADHEDDGWFQKTSAPARCSKAVTAYQPVSGEDFAEHHLLPQTPLLIADAISNATATTVWSHNYLLSIPHSLTTWVTIHEQYHVDDNAREMTLRDFIITASNRSDNATLYLRGDIPAFLQKDILIPEVLMCRDVSRLLTSHGLQIGYKPFEAPFTQSGEDNMICAISGRMYFDLVAVGFPGAGKPFPAASHFDCKPTAVSENGFDGQRVQAKIMSGDCLYLPKTWAYAVKANGPHMAVTFNWEALEQRAKLGERCGKQGSSSVLGFAKKFTRADTQRNPEDDALLHYFLFYLGDSLSSTFTGKQFTRKLKQDKTLLSKIVTWDDECEDIAKELFDTLDANGDGKFRSDDMRSINSENIDSVISLIKDRLVDFNAVIAEQQKLEARKTARKLNNLQDELGNRLMDELSKMQFPTVPDAGTKATGKEKPHINQGRQQPPKRNEEDKYIKAEKPRKIVEEEITEQEDHQEYELVDKDEEFEIIVDEDEDESPNSGSRTAPAEQQPHTNDDVKSKNGPPKN